MSTGTRSLSRRSFLSQSLVTAALPPLSLSAGVLTSASPSAASTSADPMPFNAPTADSNGLTLYQLGPQIWVRWNNRLITCYRAHPSQKYPYCYPLAGPVTGLSLTAETCLPYPHHRSLFFACDQVNDGNYWQEGFDQGQIVSSGPKVGQITKQSVEILDACVWQKPGMPPAMKDERKLSVVIDGNTRFFIDWEIRWTALVPVTIGKTNHSLFALRAAPDLTPKGGGRLVNAEGNLGEAETFGKKSAWCDFSGARTGIPGKVVEGVALFDHPQNPWSPCPWFTRDYGFISPTTFNFMDSPWRLGVDKPVTLRYRVLLHAGDVDEAEVAAQYRRWL